MSFMCYNKGKKGFKRPFVIVIYYFSLGSLFSPVFASDSTFHLLINKYDQIDSNLNNGNGFSTGTNEKGNLAWGESLILISYLDMYEGTGNDRYLDKFVIHADRIIANTDKNRNIKDYKGNSSIGWSSTKYSVNGERVMWLVHTGMIAFPLIRFAVIVKSLSLTKYSSNAKIYQEIVDLSLKLFEKDWVFDSTNGEGFYQFDTEAPIRANQPISGIPLPFNQQLAAGRVYAVLFKLTENVSYKNKVEGLSRHFKNRLNMLSNNTYIWNYWYGKGYEKFKAIEDVSHGSIDIDFVINAYKIGIVFSYDDIKIFIKTLQNNILNNNKYTRFVNGSGRLNSKMSVAVSWLDLAEYDCTIIRNYYDSILTNIRISGWREMLTLAKIVKYHNKCY